MEKEVCAELLARVRTVRPLVHHITNTVTINDCANATICAGAAPVMTDAVEEAAEMARMAGALVINIGTISPRQLESMIAAGREANRLGIPVILDPVGAGATRLRTESVERLLDELKIGVLKGNAGEIGVISGVGGLVRGVDSAGISEDPVSIAKQCARMIGSVVVISGKIDIVTDARRIFLVENGCPQMGNLSGTGCMAASVIAAYAAVEPDHAVASAVALAAFGRAGELASERSRGPYSFRTALLDELYALTGNDLALHACVRLV